MLIVLLFTASYPNGEQTFLDLEVKKLAIEFDKVILVPKNPSGRWSPIAAGVEVDETYASFLRSSSLVFAMLKSIFSVLFWQDLLRNQMIWAKPSAIMRLLRYVSSAYLTRTWIHRFFARTGYQKSECVFYTYWFDSASMGGCLAKEDFPELTVVSRAHGYDLYEDRYPVHYLPCRSQALERIDSIFPDSRAGVRYLQDRFPKYASKIKEALLGVTETGFITLPSEDKVFRIVSCAIIRPVKRMELLVEAIAKAAKKRPQQNFEWHHFGEGKVKDAREKLQTLADVFFPSNAVAYLPGYPGQDTLFQYYKDNPVDVFVNISESEGTPVSIMEAISCGIPIVATNVGGNSEIVSEENGILLKKNPTPDEIASAFFQLIDDLTLSYEKRKGSLRIWQEQYNADKNFKEFARQLASITRK